MEPEEVEAVLRRLGVENDVIFGVARNKECSENFIHSGWMGVAGEVYLCCPRGSGYLVVTCCWILMFCARVHKSHFAQAKDIERFLQDQPDFLETGNGGRPALKEAKMNDDSNNHILFFFFFHIFRLIDEFCSIYTPEN